MIVAAVTVHLKAGLFLPNGVEYVLALFLASVSLALTGSGAFSVDRLLERRREHVTEKSDRTLAAPVQVR
jgi:putative oxidoreductase